MADRSMEISHCVIFLSSRRMDPFLPISWDTLSLGHKSCDDTCDPDPAASWPEPPGTS